MPRTLRTPPPTNKNIIPRSLNSEEYYASYDHEAVLQLSSRTIICPATYERKPTVERCVGSTNKFKLRSKVYIHDDGSTQYDEQWLQQLGDRVYRHKHGEGGRKGVKNLRSNIVKSIIGSFHPSIFQPWIEEDFGTEGPEYVYMVDSDGYHDPCFFYRIHEIMNVYPEWGVICLYNAQFHSPKRNLPEKNLVDHMTAVRGMSAGISMFFRMQDFKDRPKHIQVPDGRGWDGYYSQMIGGRKIANSLVSFVEHMGRWGFHNKGNWERDRALFPTKYLEDIRDETIKEIDDEYAGVGFIA